mmetsp:Transcript_48773/g.162754  ORF Transcript_48773/g.162754 Transcript_48773/m.162754 type:complete len:253 (-) Transcript_48773:1291-2049(-)
MAAPHFLTTLRGRPQMRSPMMSPLRSKGSGERRKTASRSAKRTLKPASSTRSPNRCRSPITLSLVMLTFPLATRGSSSPGGASKRPSVAPSALSIATSTKLRSPSARVAWHQLRARSRKLLVAKSSVTVLPSHAAAAARRITASAASGSSSVGPDGTSAARGEVPPPLEPAPPAGLAAAGSPSDGSAASPEVRAGTMAHPTDWPLHQSFCTSASEAAASFGGSCASIAAASTGPPLRAHCRTSRERRERRSR